MAVVIVQMGMQLVVAVCLSLAVPGLGLSNNTTDSGEVDLPSSYSSTSGCTCVRYYLCNDTVDEDLLIDINGDPGECDHFLDKCCHNVVPLPDSPDYEPASKVPLRCGVRNKDGVAFQIKDGAADRAQYAEFPWVVAVLHPDNTENTLAYQCGGSLVHPRVVLTAAHCVDKKKNLTIRAGEWDAETEDEIHPTQDRNVSQIIVHESYETGPLVNDVALMILESPVNMSLENVGLICLPEVNETMEGRECVTAGWGKGSFDSEEKVIDVMKRRDQTVVGRGPCESALQGTRLGPKFKLHENFICADGKGKNSCEGTSGNPLACPSPTDPKMYVQAGIVSWGFGCDPLVYVNVPHFVYWMETKLQDQGIDLY